MTPDTFAYRSISELADLLARRDVSSVELTSAQLERIDTVDGQLNAYITVLHEQALLSANQADARLKGGDRGALLGIPVAVKDLFATAGVRTTAGSRVRQEFVSESDATVVQRLRAAGAVMLGKTNMMEFAYGYPHPDFGETRNPWDLTRTAGGSSGGSAAAVAAGLAYGTLGSDTGGSIRSPAAYCGVVGLKPTYGRVSRHGVVPLAWSLDHAGPLSRTVRDTALLYDVIAGFDPADPASVNQPFELSVDRLEREVAGLRVGIIEDFADRYVEPAVKQVALTAVRQLEALKVEVVPVSFSLIPLIAPTIMPIVQSEASAYHWPTLLQRPDDYSQATRDNLRLGGTVLARDYVNAQRVRRLMTEEINSLLSTVDALIFPTQPIVAPPLNSYRLGVADAQGTDVLDIEITYTGLANLTGHPAVSVPCGFTAAGLPVGLQITGRFLGEPTILALAHAYEQSCVWYTHQPM